MRKSQADYNKAHLARLRRKAHAYDKIIVLLDAVPSLAAELPAAKPITDFIERVVSDAKAEAAE